MRVRIEVSEPASLEIEEGGKIEFSGELRDLHSGDEGVVDLDEGARQPETREVDIEPPARRAKYHDVIGPIIEQSAQ